MQTFQKTSRTEYFDFLRGIAVIMVVAIHTFGQAYNYNNVSFPAVFLRQIFNCAVPLFCVSSAFFLIKKEWTVETLRKRILRVYIPLIVFSLPYFLYDVISDQNLLKSLFKLFFGGYSVYYFVALIVQFYILLPLFKRFKLFRNIIVMGFISLLWVFIYTYFIQFKHPLPLLLYGGPILCFIVYFSLGASMQLDNKKSSVNICLVLFGIGVSLCASCAESYFIMEKTNSLSGSGLKPSAVLFSIFICSLLYSDFCSGKYLSNKITKFFSDLGRYSYGIYLLHMYCIQLINKFLKNYFIGGGLLYWIIYTLIVLLISYAVLYIVKGLMPKFSRICIGV